MGIRALRHGLSARERKEVGVTLFAIYRLDVSELYIDAIGSI
jgi:hypothetical protein